MKIAFIADPLDHFKIHKDSTFAMMREAHGRGHELHVMLQEDLAWRDGEVAGDAQSLQMTGEKDAWYKLGVRRAVPLQEFDVVLMRKDPPFDMEYVYSTYLLELAQQQGARIVNDPRAIRDTNEKITIAHFPQFTVPSLVARRIDMLHEFLARHEDIILKPLDGMGGASVFRVKKTTQIST